MTDATTDQTIPEMLQRIHARWQIKLQAHSSLPCFPLDPAWSEDATGRSDAFAASACETAGAHASCGIDARDCPRARHRKALQVDHNAREQRMRAGGVPEREQRLLLAAARPDAPVLLKGTGPMRVARRLAEGHRSLIVFGGPPGVGKTVAACYLIARLGGFYRVASELARPGAELAPLKSAPLLVIDQFGRENLGKSEFGEAIFEELLDARYAADRLTICICNGTREDFESRYGEIIADRLRGDGEWCQFDGASLRGAA